MEHFSKCRQSEPSEFRWVLEIRVYPGVSNISSRIAFGTKSSKIFRRDETNHHFKYMRRMQEKNGNLVHRNKWNLKCTGCIAIVRRRLVVVVLVFYCGPTSSCLARLRFLSLLTWALFFTPSSTSTTSSLITSSSSPSQSFHHNFTQHHRSDPIRASRSILTVDAFFLSYPTRLAVASSRKPRNPIAHVLRAIMSAAEEPSNTAPAEVPASNGADHAAATESTSNGVTLCASLEYTQ
jgi:hypothetical protein